MASVTLNGDRQALEVRLNAAELSNVVAISAMNGIRSAVNTLHWSTEYEVSHDRRALFLALGEHTPSQVDAMARNIADALTAEGLVVE